MVTRRIKVWILVKINAGLVKLMRQRISPYRHLVGFGEVIDGNRGSRAGSGGIVGDGGEDTSSHVDAAFWHGWPINRYGRRVSIVARRARTDDAEGIIVVVFGVALVFVLVLVLVLVAREETSPTGRLSRLV